MLVIASITVPSTDSYSCRRGYRRTSGHAPAHTEGTGAQAAALEDLLLGGREVSGAAVAAHCLRHVERHLLDVGGGDVLRVVVGPGGVRWSLLDDVVGDSDNIGVGVEVADIGVGLGGLMVVDGGAGDDGDRRLRHLALVRHGEDVGVGDGGEHRLHLGGGHDVGGDVSGVHDAGEHRWLVLRQGVRGSGVVRHVQHGGHGLRHPLVGHLEETGHHRGLSQAGHAPASRTQLCCHD